MEAAKRIYDNSYNERQETAASAMAYLETHKGTKSESKKLLRETRREESGFVCNLISVIGSIFFCMVILGLILIPLIKETQIHKLKVGFSDHKIEIARLEYEISKVEAEFDEKINLANIEETARVVLGLEKASDAQTIYLNSGIYYSLENSTYDEEYIDLSNIADEVTNTAND